ncbi:hypothetical protein RI129_004070 [Pyrocoelia pectoralis]|uniref:Peptidase S1 domain-containing protein n=1 Tax=Pyrocoelia pectoralis TaxID=417401 RepID=A0AAN7ZQ28_9COLE
MKMDPSYLYFDSLHKQCRWYVINIFIILIISGEKKTKYIVYSTYREINVVSLQRHHHHRCGGSIIDQNNVITAAHCLGGDIFNYSIQYGVIKIVPNDVNVIQAGKEFIHEFYDPGDKSNDIAIIRFSAFSCGYGDNPFAQSEHLQTAIVYILSMEECKINCTLCLHEDSQICANNKGSDTTRGACIGDSGSPLVKIFKGKEKLAGVLSGVLTPDGICGKNEYPMLFTKVSHYVNWIKEQLLKI